MYVRIQNASRNAADLLVAENQFSHNYGSDSIKAGVSVMDDIEALAEYIAQTGIEIDPHDSVIVELRGYRSDDDADDAHLGEKLIHPTEILSVEPASDEFFAMVNEAMDRIYG